MTVTLGLGIGANASLFSVLQSVLLRPLPYRDADRLVMIWESHAEKGLTEATASYPNLQDWQRSSKSLEAVGGYQFMPFDLTGVEQPERIWGARVTTGLLPLLGVPPYLGSLPEDKEDREGKGAHGPVAVVSDSLWRRLGGEASLIGRPLRLSGRSYTVVAVMPPRFQFPPPLQVRGQTMSVPVEVWIPVTPGAAERDRSSRLFFPVGRLAPLETVQQAQAELSMVAERLARSHPEDNSGWGIRVVPLREQMVRHVRAAFRVMLATAAFVLLMACGNVAFLLLVRYSARRQELALRVALGAGRLRLAGLLLGETLALGVLGGALGLLLARAGLGLITTLAPRDIPRLDEVSLDGPALAFTLALSMTAVLAAGFLPAVRAIRAASGLRFRVEGSAADGAEAIAGRHLLVVAEIALALVLVVAVGLMGRSFLRLVEVDLGFVPRGLIALELQLPPGGYSEEQRVLAFQREAVRRIAGLPGVGEVGVINFPPMSGFKLQTTVTLTDRPLPVAADRPMAEYRVLTPEAANALRLPVVAGRGFTEGDDETADGVALVSRSFARRYWPDGPDGRPVGRTLALSPLAGALRGQVTPEAQSFRIVGVVGDAVQVSLEAEPPPVVYVPYAQDPWPFFSILVRTQREPAGIGGEIRREVAALDRNLAVGNLRAVDENVAASLARPRFLLALLAAFSALALALAAVGVFGLIAALMSRRNREVALRIALGARGGDLCSMVLRDVLPALGAGLAGGLAAAFGFTRWMSAVLFETSPVDLPTYAAAALVVALVSLLAACLPVLRALRSAPMDRLKSL